MAIKTVNFTVTPDGGVQGFWIAVNDDDVTLNNGKGSIALDDQEDHTLVWAFIGNPGGKISIEGDVGANAVVTVKNSAIPPGRHRSAGFKDFRL